jgi:hypothetical protein
VKHGVWLPLVLACSAGPRAQDASSLPRSYPIHLNRAVHVGERWHVVADGTQDESSSTYTEQVVVKKSERHQIVHLDATVSALAVENGVVSRADYVVIAFDRGKDHREVVGAGKHVVIQTAPKKDDTVVEIDGQSATADVREALGVIMPLTREPGDEDAVFGTNAAQRIGASWPVNVAAMKVALLHNGASATDDAIHGRVTLAGVDRDRLDLRVDLHVDSFTPTAPLPEGSQITKSKVLMQIEFELPTSTARTNTALRSELELHTEFEAFVPVQSAEVAGVTVDSRSDLRRSAAYTPLTR